MRTRASIDLYSRLARAACPLHDTTRGRRAQAPSCCVWVALTGVSLHVLSADDEVKAQVTFIHDQELKKYAGERDAKERERAEAEAEAEAEAQAQALEAAEPEDIFGDFGPEKVAAADDGWGSGKGDATDGWGSGKPAPRYIRTSFLV